MKYSFRDVEVFEYIPERKEVILLKMKDERIGFNFCNFIPEDYKLMSRFFEMAYKHSIGEITTEDLKDIEVY